MIILLVEDSKPARNLLKSYINEIGTGHTYNYVEVDTGESALNMMGSRRIDLVFLDLNLNEEMTGMDVLKEIRKNEKWKSIPVIMVTSDSDKTKVIESLKCGANEYIVKPIDLKNFKDKVFKIIKNAW